jgi:hypothetical protein
MKDRKSLGEWRRDLRRGFARGLCWGQSRRPRLSAAWRLQRRNRFLDARGRSPFRSHPVSHPQPLDVWVLQRRNRPPSRPHHQVEHQHQAAWEREGHAEGSDPAPPCPGKSATACVARRPHRDVLRALAHRKPCATDAKRECAANVRRTLLRNDRDLLTVRTRLHRATGTTRDGESPGRLLQDERFCTKVGMSVPNPVPRRDRAYHSAHFVARWRAGLFRNRPLSTGSS